MINVHAITVRPDAVRHETIDEIARFSHTLPEGSPRDAIESMVSALRSGVDFLAGRNESTVTPSQAAQLLGVSRAHFCKALDAGALPYSVVGKRDRRIALADLFAYRSRTEELRRISAAAAARVHAIEDLSLDEM